MSLMAQVDRARSQLQAANEQLSEARELLGLPKQEAPKEPEEKGFFGKLKDNLSDIGHTVLDVAGLVPVLGAPADALNGVWYAAEGDWVNAGLSAAGMIPFVGEAAVAAKLGNRAVDAVRAGDEVVDAARAGDEVADAARAGDEVADAARAGDEVAGPYSHLADPPGIEAGKNFSPKQKEDILTENRSRNGGVVRSDLSGTELVQPQKSMRGVTPDPNEWQIDHKVPKDKGGNNSYANAQVLSRQENRAKSNN